MPTTSESAQAPNAAPLQPPRRRHNLSRLNEWFERRFWRERYTLGRRMGLGLGLLVALLAIGVTGYMLIEGWRFDDALFMTVITLGTVGYSTVHNLSVAGQGAG